MTKPPSGDFVIGTPSRLHTQLAGTPPIVGKSLGTMQPLDPELIGYRAAGETEQPDKYVDGI